MYIFRQLPRNLRTCTNERGKLEKFCMEKRIKNEIVSVLFSIWYETGQSNTKENEITSNLCGAIEMYSQGKLNLLALAMVISNGNNHRKYQSNDEKRTNNTGDNIRIPGTNNDA